jgi:hypothetical protein
MNPSNRLINGLGAPIDLGLDLERQYAVAENDTRLRQTMLRRGA